MSALAVALMLDRNDAAFFARLPAKEFHEPTLDVDPVRRDASAVLHAVIGRLESAKERAPHVVARTQSRVDYEGT